MTAHGISGTASKISDDKELVPIREEKRAEPRSTLVPKL